MIFLVIIFFSVFMQVDFLNKGAYNLRRKKYCGHYEIQNS